MTKIPTLYSDYRECMLDLDIYGKIVATPQQSIQELTETLFEEFQRRKPMPTLEYKRYELSRLVNPDFRIAYNKELELQDNERLLDLQSDLEASFENIDFEDLTSLIPTTKELFSYENHITDDMRSEIISKYDLSTGEAFKPGINQTENIVGSVSEDDSLTLSEEKIKHLGVDEDETTITMAEDPMEVVRFKDNPEDVKYEIEDDEVTLEDDYAAEDDELEDYTSSESDSGGNSENDSDSDEDDDYEDYDSEEDDDSDYDDYDSEDEDNEYETDDDSDDDDLDTQETEEDYDDYGSDSDEEDYDDYDSDSEESSDDEDYDDYNSEDTETELEEYDNEENSESETDYDDYGESKDEPSNESNTQGVVEKSIDFDNDNFDVSSFIDSVQDEPVIKQSEHIVNKVVETPITPLDVRCNNPPQSEIIDRSSEPTEIRAFLRKHPRCEYDFALKYFTKKQINDAIKIGKIIKKGNILKI